MRILHTGDWHLGKLLGSHSRLPEQAEFIDELVNITREKAVDMIIVAGDVFDTYNPPADAERLFYQALKRLTAARDVIVPVAVIAGNHDNPVRLAASSPIAVANGAIIIGSVDSKIPPGDYGGFRITRSAGGCFEVETHGGSASVVGIPYPSPHLSDKPEDSYSDRIGCLMDELSTFFTNETVNILAGHFYITGSMSTKDSERPLTIGGAYAVDGHRLPEKAQYVAMGHLHRPQAVSGHACAFYAGSPIQFSLSEINYAKCVILADMEPGCAPVVEKVCLRNYKPLEEWETASIEEAITLVAARADVPCWAVLNIKTDRPLTQSELKQLRGIKRDLVEIRPVMDNTPIPNVETVESERSPGEMFAAFYRSKRNAPPPEALAALFNKLSRQAEDG